jgi:hypothetical protein
VAGAEQGCCEPVSNERGVVGDDDGFAAHGWRGHAVTLSDWHA